MYTFRLEQLWNNYCGFWNNYQRRCDIVYNLLVKYTARLDMYIAVDDNVPKAHNFAKLKTASFILAI